MDVLGNDRGLLRDLFGALVIVDQEVRRFERRPDKGGIELAMGR